MPLLVHVKGVNDEAVLSNLRTQESFSTRQMVAVFLPTSPPQQNTHARLMASLSQRSTTSDLELSLRAVSDVLRETAVIVLSQKCKLNFCKRHNNLSVSNFVSRGWVLTFVENWNFLTLYKWCYWGLEGCLTTRRYRSILPRPTTQHTSPKFVVKTMNALNASGHHQFKKEDWVSRPSAVNGPCLQFQLAQRFLESMGWWNDGTW